MKLRMVCVVVGFLSLVLSLAAQTASGGSTSSQVPPPLIQFSNVATDEGGNTLSGVVSITFSLYNSQQGGQPLWTETQNDVQLDPTGHYSVQLGITKPAGVPTTLFTSGEARWLGVQVQGQAEQPRVLLLSVPYALKAGDATTIGGLPPSAFVLAVPQSGVAAASATESATRQRVSPATATDVTTTGGTADYLPMFNGASTIIDSVVFQSGSGSTAKVGINTTTPASTLDVYGAATVRGALSLPTQGTATAATGVISHTLNLTASAFNSSTGKAVNQAFRWQAEPAGNDTSSPSGTMNLLFAQGSSTPAETGVNITSNGEINGGVLNATTSFDLGGIPFAYGSFANENAFLGFAGNLTTTARLNTAVGNQALASITTGITANTAVGDAALFANTTGYLNTAVGVDALGFNINGFQNTAVGNSALQDNNAGFSNTAVGNDALAANLSGDYNTASGFYALYSSLTSSNNTASGFEALYNSTGSYNTASGSGALYGTSPDASTGNFNVATGYVALNVNTSGYENTASGAYALFFNNTGFSNTATGTSALLDNTTGQENTATGMLACSSNTTGSGLICTGFNADVARPDLHNATAIGAHAMVSVSNAVVLGSVAGVNGAKATARVGIGTTSPTNLLTLGKGAGPSIADGWTTYSSRRWKTNIIPLRNALGLVEQLRGVSYDLKDSGKHEIGVIAEEVGEVVPEVVSYEENGKDARGVDYSRLTALLIEAVKQQQREIRNLKSEVRTTRQSLQKVQAQIAAAQPALVAAK